ncbi:MAG TPA: flagellar hook-length control protein FliK [Patescibacteria group bacterium]|nr:flagellar hook-length control protein FliK [Patescibacteria group bacterium]
MANISSNFSFGSVETRSVSPDNLFSARATVKPNGKSREGFGKVFDQTVKQNEQETAAETPNESSETAESDQLTVVAENPPAKSDQDVQEKSIAQNGEGQQAADTDSETPVAVAPVKKVPAEAVTVNSQSVLAALLLQQPVAANIPPQGEGDQITIPAVTVAGEGENVSKVNANVLTPVANTLAQVNVNVLTQVNSNAAAELPAEPGSLPIPPEVQVVQPTTGLQPDTISGAQNVLPDVQTTLTAQHAPKLPFAVTEETKVSFPEMPVVATVTNEAANLGKAVNIPSNAAVAAYGLRVDGQQKQATESTVVPASGKANDLSAASETLPLPNVVIAEPAKTPEFATVNQQTAQVTSRQQQAGKVIPVSKEDQKLSGTPKESVTTPESGNVVNIEAVRAGKESAAGTNQEKASKFSFSRNADVPKEADTESVQKSVEFSILGQSMGQVGETVLSQTTRDISAVASVVATAPQTTPTIATAEQPLTAPFYPPADSSDVLGQIVENARLINATDKTEMVIQLKPEHLGELTIKVHVSGGIVNASFHSGNSDVRGILEASLPQLKQDLANQGIKVDNVDIQTSLEQYTPNQHQGQWSHSSGQSQKNQQNMDGANDLEDMEIPATDAAGINRSVDGVDYRA